MVTYICSVKKTDMTTTDYLTILFFVVLMVASFITGVWLEKGEKERKQKTSR